MKIYARASLVLMLFVALPLFSQEAPGEALFKRLQQLNATVFATGSTDFGKLEELRKSQADGQKPEVAILSCADSRTPPELIFRQSLGSIFVVRTAGNIADPFAIASLEYAVTRPLPWNTVLIIVMGHSDCGAVKAALNPGDAPTPSLQALFDRIRESFLFSAYPYSEKPTAQFLLTATEANARNAANYLIAHSSVLREKVGSRKLTIMPAYYDIPSGLVRGLR